MKTAIIGVGLIGGSFALALKDNGIGGEIIGVDNSADNRKKALELGLVDRVEEFDKAIEEADFIVLATIWALCFHRFLSSDILCS